MSIDVAFYTRQYAWEAYFIFEVPCFVVQSANIFMLFGWPYMIHTMMSVTYSRQYQYLHPVKRKQVAARATKAFDTIAVIAVFCFLFLHAPYFFMFFVVCLHCYSRK